MIEYPEWLSEDGRKVFDLTLPKIKNVSTETLEMLAAYSGAVVELKRTRESNPKMAPWWRRAMIYARNGLGIGPVIFVDHFEILIDSPFGPGEKGPYPWEHLDRSWQLPESMRPADNAPGG